MRRKTAATAWKEIALMLGEALDFYANPETYIAIGFFPDSPCGAFIDDFKDMGAIGYKPGETARKALRKAIKMERVLRAAAKPSRKRK